MVIWGVAEFSMHTFRPNTIERENRIVTAFKNTTDTIWKTHESLQIGTTQITRQLQTVLQNSQDADSLFLQKKLIDFMESSNSKLDWVVTKNNQVFWWSNNINRDLVNEITQNGSVIGRFLQLQRYLKSQIHIPDMETYIKPQNRQFQI